MFGSRLALEINNRRRDVREGVMNSVLERLLRNVALSCVILFVTGMRSSLVAGSCDNAPSAQIEIEITKSEITEAYDITAADIQRIAESTGQQPTWPGLGAARADIPREGDHPGGVDKPLLLPRDRGTGKSTIRLGAARLFRASLSLPA